MHIFNSLKGYVKPSYAINDNSVVQNSSEEESSADANMFSKNYWFGEQDQQAEEIKDPWLPQLVRFILKILNI